MKRREFIGTTAAGASLTAQPGPLAGPPNGENPAGVVVERARAGRPHAGKVLLAIQPHADDIPLFAAGTVAKLLEEGYTGHLVRVTNDDMAGPGTIGETVLANEKDNDQVARVLVDWPALSYDPVYSPDGSEIAFASTVAGGGWEIYRQRLADGRASRVTFAGGDARYPDYRPARR